VTRYGGEVQPVLCEFEPVLTATFDAFVTIPPSPSLVQVNTAFDASLQTISSTFLSGVSAGNMIIAAVGGVQLNGTLNQAHLSDSLGNVYTIIGGYLSSDAGYGISMWYSPGITGGTCTVTLTTTGGSVGFARLNIHEVSRVAFLGNHNIAKGAAYPLDSGAINPAEDRSFVLGWGVTDNGTTTPGSGFSIAAVNQTEATEWKVQTPPGALDVTYPGDGASGSWVCMGAAFHA
jgi:hypothetical protein